MYKTSKYVGQILETRNCDPLKVIKLITHNGGQGFKVKFLRTGTILEIGYASIITRSVKDPYHPNVYGKGYLGVGKHIATANGKSTKLYDLWRNMLQRCYDTKFSQQKYYKDIDVCPRWLCFQSFADDVTNMAGYGKADFELDKDLLVAGNKVYGPDTCRFLPRELNHAIVSIADYEKWRKTKAAELQRLMKKHSKHLDKPTVKGLNRIITALS